MDINITVSERDAEEMKTIGDKPWHKTTDEERKRYDTLIKFYGTEVAFKVRGKR